MNGVRVTAVMFYSIDFEFSIIRSIKAILIGC
jgi:hypothetical protein